MTTIADTIVLEQRLNLEKHIIPNFIHLDSLNHAVDFNFMVQYTLGIIKLMANYDNVYNAIVLFNKNSKNIEILFEYENCQKINYRGLTTSYFRFIDLNGKHSDQLHELYFVDKTQCKFEILID